MAAPAGASQAWVAELDGRVVGHALLAEPTAADASGAYAERVGFRMALEVVRKDQVAAGTGTAT